MKQSTTTKLILSVAILFGVFFLGGTALGLRQYFAEVRRVQCDNNLKQLGLAFHHHDDTMTRFPPAFAAREDGKPIHSWRVAILPFLEQRPLFDKYKFDEPWDGPHNSALAGEIYRNPYACSRAGKKPLSTSYVMIVGKGCLFDGARIPTMSDIRDTGNRILLVEWETGANWIEPKDLEFSALLEHVKSGKLPESAGGHGKGLHALMFDGTTRFFPPSKLSEVQLRKMCIIDDLEASP